MYQIKLSTDNIYYFWIDYLLNETQKKIVEINGVSAEYSYKRRTSICFATESENSATLKQIVNRALIDMFSVEQKRAYFENNLTMRFCDVTSKNMLINTLTAFNSEAEKSLIKSRLKLTSDFNLDGFYNFRMNDIVSEWKESIQMIVNNSELVENEDSFNIIMKFLLSGIEARIKVVSVSENDAEYMLNEYGEIGGSRFLSVGQLLLTLVDIAPEKVIVENSVTDQELRKKLSEIFCVKEDNFEKL